MPQQYIKKVTLKDETIGECLVVSSHVPTLKHKVEHRLLTQEMAVSPALGNKQTAVSGSLAAVQLCVLASVHERTLLNIQQLFHLLKQPF